MHHHMQFSLPTPPLPSPQGGGKVCELTASSRPARSRCRSAARRRAARARCRSAPGIPFSRALAHRTSTGTPSPKARANSNPCCGKIPISSLPSMCAEKSVKGFLSISQCRFDRLALRQIQGRILEHHGETLGAADHQESPDETRVRPRTDPVVLADEADGDLAVAVAQLGRVPAADLLFVLDARRAGRGRLGRRHFG